MIKDFREPVYTNFLFYILFLAGCKFTDGLRSFRFSHSFATHSRSLITAAAHSSRSRLSLLLSRIKSFRSIKSLQLVL